MVSYQSKTLTIDIWLEMGNSPHRRQNFFLIGWIIGLRSVVASWSISNNILLARVIILSENCSQTQWTLIRIQLEAFGDMWTSKHWSRIQSLLQCLKYLPLLTTPSPRLVLACENDKRFRNQAKVLDKSTVVICQAQESSKSRTSTDGGIFSKAFTLACCTPKPLGIIMWPRYASWS